MGEGEGEGNPILMNIRTSLQMSPIYWSALVSFQQADSGKMTVPAEPKKTRATSFIATVKESLSQLNYDVFSEALKQYKMTDDFSTMLSQMSGVFLEDQRKHILLRGMMVL